MIDEDIINNVIEDNSESEQESSTPRIIRTIRHDDVMSAFNTCYKWAEDNNGQAGTHPHIEKIARKSSERGI
jgi:hypothetical protein